MEKRTELRTNWTAEELLSEFRDYRHGITEEVRKKAAAEADRRNRLGQWLREDPKNLARWESAFRGG